MLLCGHLVCSTYFRRISRFCLWCLKVERAGGGSGGARGGWILCCSHDRAGLCSHWQLVTVTHTPTHMHPHTPQTALHCCLALEHEFTHCFENICIGTIGCYLYERRTIGERVALTKSWLHFYFKLWPTKPQPPETSAGKTCLPPISCVWKGNDNTAVKKVENYCAVLAQLCANLAC